jgi:hypothetical protein
VRVIGPRVVLVDRRARRREGDFDYGGDVSVIDN